MEVGYAFFFYLELHLAGNLGSTFLGKSYQMSSVTEPISLVATEEKKSGQAWSHLASWVSVAAEPCPAILSLLP